MADKEGVVVGVKAEFAKLIDLKALALQNILPFRRREISEFRSLLLCDAYYAHGNLFL